MPFKRITNPDQMLHSGDAFCFAGFDVNLIQPEWGEAMLTEHRPGGIVPNWVGEVSQEYIRNAHPGCEIDFYKKVEEPNYPAINVPKWAFNPPFYATNQDDPFQFDNIMASPKKREKDPDIETRKSVSGLTFPKSRPSEW